LVHGTRRIAVDRLAVLELAEHVAHAGHTDTAALLLVADASGDERVALSIKDRESVIDVLDDPPDTLAELHDILVLEQMSRSLGQWRSRQGHRTPRSYRTRPAHRRPPWSPSAAALRWVTGSRSHPRVAGRLRPPCHDARMRLLRVLLP
jgi:hypothetical protein